MADIREFDELDRRIVELMCRSSQGSYRQIAKQLGIHPTTLIQRVKNLEAKGVINGYRAKVDYMRLGFDYMGIIQVYVEKNMLDVQETIRSIPQVLAVFDVTGECDSIVWIACRDRDSMQGQGRVLQYREVHLEDRRRPEDEHIRRAERDEGSCGLHTAGTRRCEGMNPSISLVKTL